MAEFRQLARGAIHGAAVWLLAALPVASGRKRALVWRVAPRVVLVASALILDATGRVLVLRSRYNGEWQLPGGLVGRGEPFELAVRREVQEELGVSCSSVELLTLWRSADGRWLNALYGVSLIPGELRLSVEHSALRYVSQDDLPASIKRLLPSKDRDKRAGVQI